VSWSNIIGWFDFADVYDQAVAECPPHSSLVEIGVCYGRSLAYLAQKAIDSGKPCAIYGVDPLIDDMGTATQSWGGEHAPWARSLGGPFNAFVSSMLEHAPHCLERVNFLRCTSVSAARLFEDGSVFFVFVDGSHYLDPVRADLEAWERKVAAGGIFAGHDHGIPDVAQAVRERWTDGETELRGECWWRRVR